MTAQMNFCYRLAKFPVREINYWLPQFRSIFLIDLLLIFDFFFPQKRKLLLLFFFKHCWKKRNVLIFIAMFGVGEMHKTFPICYFFKFWLQIVFRKDIFILKLMCKWKSHYCRYNGIYIFIFQCNHMHKALPDNKHKGPDLEWVLIVVY